MSVRSILSKKAIDRSRTIAALRKELVNAQGYHATKLGDDIHVHEVAVAMYADLIIFHATAESACNV